MGPGPSRVRGLFHNNTLNEIGIFDLSLATCLYALTNYASKIMGGSTSWYQPKLDLTSVT